MVYNTQKYCPSGRWTKSENPIFLYFSICCVVTVNIEKIILKHNRMHGMKFIRASFLSVGLQLPESPSSVIALIHNYYSKTELHNEKSGAFKCKNNKMSICIDEWTTCRNWRYMNIHTQNYWVFGLCPSSPPLEDRNRSSFRNAVFSSF
jgi:hypothetical protein